MERELFVISDLHLGGRYGEAAGDRGFRINTHVDELERFVDEVRELSLASGRRTELVIGGDLVDFLAEEGPGAGAWRAFIAEQDEAVATLDEIVQRDRGFFDALGRLARSGARLTLLLGNHDVELSLPAVRQRLRFHLGVEDEGSFRFIYDGEAYVAGDVLIEHGNRNDGWNVVDYDRLRRFRSESSRRLPISRDAEFEPPAGSRLVERIMNPLKEDYGFVDLLKPERETVIPLLIALEPSLAWSIGSIATARRLGREAAGHEPRAPARPARPGDIGGRAATAAAPDRPLDVPEWEDLLATLGEAERARLMTLVERAEGVAATESRNIAAGVVGRALSFVRLARADELEERLDVLLDSLRALQGDRSFVRSEETDARQWDAARAFAEKGFATIVFGHTHLAKDVPLQGGGRYLNTGTWADVMRLPADVFADEPQTARASLRRFAEALRRGKFDAYVEFLPTFAHIRQTADRHTISARLRDYEPGTIGES